MVLYYNRWWVYVRCDRDVRYIFYSKKNSTRLCTSIVVRLFFRFWNPPSDFCLYIFTCEAAFLARTILCNNISCRSNFDLRNVYSRKWNFLGSHPSLSIQIVADNGAKYSRYKYMWCCKCTLFILMYRTHYTSFISFSYDERCVKQL